MEHLTTGSLFTLRQLIIFWTHIAVWPFEFAFDQIGDELEDRGYRVRSSNEA